MKTIPMPNDTLRWVHYRHLHRQKVTNIDRLNRRNSLKQPQRNLAPIAWCALAVVAWTALIVVGVKVGEWLGK